MKALFAYGQKLPVIAVGVQAQLQYAECIGRAAFAIGGNADDGSQLRTACSHDEFAYSMPSICKARRVLWREPFVVMIMAVDDDVCSRLIEQAPEGSQLRIVAVAA